MNTLSTTNKPEVLVFSDGSILTSKLIKELEKIQCSVSINKVSLSPNYIIFINRGVENYGDELPVDEISKVNQAIELTKKFQTNTLFIFPYRSYPDLNIEILNLVEIAKNQNKDLIGLLFLGDLINRKINLNDKRFISRVFKNISESKPIETPKDDSDIHLITVGEAAKQIIRRLFSFGVGDSTALVSQAIKPSLFAHVLKKIKSGLEIISTDESYNYPIIDKIKNTEYSTIDIEIILKKLVDHFTLPPKPVENPKSEPTVKYRVHEEAVKPIPMSESESSVKPEAFHFSKIELAEVSMDPPPPPSVPKKHRSLKAPVLSVKFNKKIAYLFSTVFFVLIMPYVFLALGGASLIVAKKQVSSGNLQSVSTLNGISSSLFRFSMTELDILSKIPLIGGVFEPSEYMATTAYNTTGLISRGLTAVNLASNLAEKILGKGTLEVDYLSRELSLELGSIYKDLSFLEGDLENEKGVVGYFLNKLYGDIPLRDIRQDITNYESLTRNLSELLGMNGKKTYLILLQNNMELRPSGGFIGSYALASFEGGKLIDLSVQDVYDADGQLTGHVEPPAPIKDYLGEANWYLRDSNWDPDFSTSAQRAEWFLDKELDQQVDGVIGIDLEVARELIKSWGEIKLTDFNQVLSSENFYQVTQSQVEEDFFPGSRKKSVFLTSLARELLNKLTNIEKKDFSKISKVLFDNLETRHIQTYLHEPDSQKAISGLGWSGSITIPACEGNCYYDYTSVIDANVGVNKANYFVKRSLRLDVSIAKNIVTRTLTVVYQNTGDEIYKTYTRVVAPSGSEFDKGDNSPDVTDVRGKKEAGVLIEVKPRSTGRSVFKWSSYPDLDVKKSGRYEVYFRKQAGTSYDPLVVNINRTSYNTTLEKDFSTRITW